MFEGLCKAHLPDHPKDEVEGNWPWQRELQRVAEEHVTFRKKFYHEHHPQFSAVQEYENYKEVFKENYFS